MKTALKVTLVLCLVGLFYSFQSTHQVLSKSDKRLGIRNEIPNDDSMSKDMMGILMSRKRVK